MLGYHAASGSTIFGLLYYMDCHLETALHSLLLYALGLHKSSPVPTAASSCRTTFFLSYVLLFYVENSVVALHMHYAVSDVVLQQVAHV